MVARFQGKPESYLKIEMADHGNRGGRLIMALNDISFKINQCDVLGIIGGNGA